jgi:diacylglycerol kinase (ATP)
MIEPFSTSIPGLRRLCNAFIFSKQGFQACFRHEAAFRQEIFFSLILIPLGLFLGETSAEKFLLAGSVLLLLIVELINSAIERVVDRISPDHHTLSGEAKDMGSAAVLLTVGLAILAWGIILLT